MERNVRLLRDLGVGMKKLLYTVSGSALDQETILRQKSWIEDHIREEKNIKFAHTKLRWDMNKDKTFNFTLDFFG